MFLGETALDLILPQKIQAGVFKARGHWGRLDWNEFKTRDWSRYKVPDKPSDTVTEAPIAD